MTFIGIALILIAAGLIGGGDKNDPRRVPPRDMVAIGFIAAGWFLLGRVIG